LVADNYRHKGLFDKNIKNNSFVEEVNSESADFSELDEDNSDTNFSSISKNKNTFKLETEDDDIKLYSKLFPASASESSIRQEITKPKIEDVIILEKNIPALEKVMIEDTSANFNDDNEEEPIEIIESIKETENLINEQREDNVDTEIYSADENNKVTCEIDDDFADFKFETDDTTKFYIDQIQNEENEENDDVLIEENKIFRTYNRKKENTKINSEPPSIKEEVIELLRRFTGNDKN